MTLMMIYLVIGLVLSFYWWDKTYKKDYNKAKASDKGVEEGMAVNELLIMMFFWPMILTLNLFFNKRI